jgi:signal transduction histidine kinase
MNELSNGSDTWKLLLVDDNADNLGVLRDTLTPEGYDLFFASSGEKAIEIALQAQPHLILLDVMMPGIDGFETCQKLKEDERTKDIPVIFITAKKDSEDIVKGFSVGGVDYVPKPFFEEEVCARVRTHMELINLRKKLEEKVQERTIQLEELAKANEKLNDFDRLKSMFIASMSHEFRTPLNSIIGFTGILLMEMVGKLEPKQIDLLKRVKKSSEHLLSLINDVIDISKIEAGKIETINSKFVLDKVIDEAVHNLETIRNNKGLDIKVNVPLSLEFYNDRKRVYQCILNLLSNAIKYTEKGWISISVRQLKDEVEVVVEDTGIGIAEKDLSKLFLPFVRLDATLRMKELGTGLGLYLTKKMASEILGGSVRVESRPGVGSKFFLNIPLHRQPENEHKPNSFSLDK